MHLFKKLVAVGVCSFMAHLTSHAQGVVTQNGLLKVNGNTIENESGQPFRVAGNSIFWSGFTAGIPFYTAQNAPVVVEHLATEWNSGLVRAAMAVEEADGTPYSVSQPNFADNLQPTSTAQGYFNNPARELERVENIIDAAIANDIYVLVDFHSHFAQFFKEEAITFFTHIATKYGNDKHIIYEIFNEPISTENHRNSNENRVFSDVNLQRQTWNNIIKPYAIDVINAIRAIDPDNLIVVGTPGFSQFVNIAADNRITRNDLNLPANADLNLAYTLHFYSGTHKQFLRDIATEALNDGIALFVTEWGTVNADGNGAVDVQETIRWMDFMRDNNLSHANWSITDKNEGSAVIRDRQGINGLLNNQLTESGTFVRCLIENFNAKTFYGNCNTTNNSNSGPSDGASVPQCSDGGGVVPTGIGNKVEIETPTQSVDFCGNRSDFRQAGLSVIDFQGQGVITGYGGAGKSAVFSLEPINEDGNYTIQLVFSSNGTGSELLLQRDSGNVNLTSSTIKLPDTGGLNNYQLISVSGIPFTTSTKDIAINIFGDANVNVESFYYTRDEDPALSINSFFKKSDLPINLYPVPTSTTVNLELPDVGDAALEYTIYNLKGQVIKSVEALKGNTIDVEGLADGFYLLNLHIDGKLKVLKFVKN